MSSQESPVPMQHVSKLPRAPHQYIDRRYQTFEERIAATDDLLFVIENPLTEKDKMIGLGNLIDVVLDRAHRERFGESIYHMLDKTSRSWDESLQSDAATARTGFLYSLGLLAHIDIVKNSSNMLPAFIGMDSITPNQIDLFSRNAMRAMKAENPALHDIYSRTFNILIDQYGYDHENKDALRAGLMLPYQAVMWQNTQQDITAATGTNDYFWRYRKEWNEANPISEDAFPRTKLAHGRSGLNEWQNGLPILFDLNEVISVDSK